MLIKFLFSDLFKMWFLFMCAMQYILEIPTELHFTSMSRKKNMVTQPIFIQLG